MRLAKKDVEERETFVSNFLRQNPKTSYRQLNALLVKKFGKTMRFVRVQEIRAGVLLGNHAQ